MESEIQNQDNEDNQNIDKQAELTKKSINNSNFIIFLPLIISISIIVGMIISFVYFSGDKTADLNSMIGYKKDKLNTIIDIVEEVYVDSIDKVTITENVIADMLQKLDPHSNYIPKKDLTFINEDLTGEFEGIGVQFSLNKDTILVINTVPLGPSEKVGIRSGDKIIKVDDTLFVGADIDNMKVVNKLRGKSGSKVKLGIQRREAKDLLEFYVTRAKIPTYSVDAQYMIEPSIGYIKINKFSAQTYSEYIKAVTQLKLDGMQTLILDLKGNGGGYLDAAINIADDFLNKDELIVYTKGKSKPISYSYATKKGNFKKGKLIVLVDEWSASASEIVAGAVQDNDRGIIIGRRSFGKGLVQEQIEMSDGSAIRLTVARYYTPSGRSIQKPYDAGSEKYYDDFYESVLKEYTHLKDSNLVKGDTLKYYTKAGKIVYGGGGIYPDIYIPFDTVRKSNYYYKLERAGIIFDFSFNYFVNNRNALTKYKTIHDFDKNFNITKGIMLQLLTYAKENGIKTDNNAEILSDITVKNILKSLIARNLFGEKGFYFIYNQNDNIIKKAVEIASDNN